MAHAHKNTNIIYIHTQYWHTDSVYSIFILSFLCLPHKSFISFFRWHTFHLTGRTAPWCSSHSLMTPLKWTFSMPLTREEMRYERSSMTLVSVVWIHISSSDKPWQTLGESTEKDLYFFIMESIGWLNKIHTWTHTCTLNCLPFPQRVVNGTSVTSLPGRM